MKYKQSIEQLKEDNYSAIVEAFEHLLFSNNNDLKKVSMNEVARHANLTKRTIYKYFDSKDELLYEIMIRGYKVMHKHMKKSLREKSDEVKLYSVFTSFYEYSKIYSNYYKLIMNYQTKKEDFNNPTDRVKECYSLGQITIQYLIDAIQDGVDKGDFRDDLNVIESTILVWSFATGLLNNMSHKLDYVHEYYNINPDTFVEHGMKRIMDLLR